MSSCCLRTTIFAGTEIASDQVPTKYIEPSHCSNSTLYEVNYISGQGAVTMS